MSWTRRWHRAASAVLLVASGVHLAAHRAAFLLDDDRGEATRRAAIDAMQAYVVFPPWGTTLWTVLGAFSLAYAVALVLFATSQWVLAREADPPTLRRHALRNALLMLLGCLALLALHPQPQLLVVFGVATLLYGAAAWPRPLDR